MLPLSRGLPITRETRADADESDTLSGETQLLRLHRHHRANQNSRAHQQNEGPGDLPGQQDIFQGEPASGEGEASVLTAKPGEKVDFGGSQRRRQSECDSRHQPNGNREGQDPIVDPDVKAAAAAASKGN